VDPVALARRYLDLSNAQDLDATIAMFADDAIYGSTAVGGHGGRTAIGEMMRAFFARYADARWTVDGIVAIDDATAEFAFVMDGTDGETGERVERRGVERIAFDGDGRIVGVEVRVGS
jgi:hypothetical protein